MDQSSDHKPLIHEFVLRKEQILNLEIRLFMLIFAIEALFAVFYIFGQERLNSAKYLPWLALTVFLVLFFELIAINGKMGLTSQYLRQLERHLAALGYGGIFWETRALDKIIFAFPRPNAFTLPAGLTLGMIVAQLLYAVYFAVSKHCGFAMLSFILTACSFIIFFIIFKSMTVDFGRKLPDIFDERLFEKTTHASKPS